MGKAQVIRQHLRKDACPPDKLCLDGNDHVSYFAQQASFVPAEASFVGHRKASAATALISIALT